MTYDQSPKEFESATLGFVFFDEPPPEEIYKASIARLRKGGICGIFATPLMGSAWLYDEIVANPKAEEQFRFFLEAEVEDACKIHGVRGFLEHDQIVKMVSQYKEEDMISRVFGKFQHLVGLVFKEFSKEVHVLEPFELNQDDYCVYVSWDTHPREPEMISWVAVDAKGRCIVVDELYSDAPTEELVARIKSIDSKYRVVKRVMDPAGFIEDKRTGDSFAKLLAREYGLNFEPASKRRSDAIRLMKDAFHYQIAGGEMIVKPMLLTTSNCTRFIWELLHWQWQEYTGKTAEKRGKNPRPQDKDDHAIEAVGRVLLENPVFIPRDLDFNNGSSVEYGVHEDPFE
jgi:phage terminase large subunit-like protein